MYGRIDTTFGTYQADLFESGLVAQIGANAFTVWSLIKAHSNFNNGVSWPSVRRLMAQTGLASATVQKALATLEAAHLLRSTRKGKRRYYVARERLDVRLGDRILCTVVVDYVPKSLRQRLQAIKAALETGEKNPAAFANVDIIPGNGFTWDPNAGVLRASISVDEIPHPPDPLSDEELAPLARKVREISRRTKNSVMEMLNK